MTATHSHQNFAWNFHELISSKISIHITLDQLGKYKPIIYLTEISIPLVCNHREYFNTHKELIKKSVTLCTEWKILQRP